MADTTITDSDPISKAYVADLRARANAAHLLGDKQDARRLMSLADACDGSQWCFTAGRWRVIYPGEPGYRYAY